MAALRWIFLPVLIAGCGRPAMDGGPRREVGRDGAIPVFTGDFPPCPAVRGPFIPAIWTSADSLVSGRVSFFDGGAYRGRFRLWRAERDTAGVASMDVWADAEGRFSARLAEGSYLAQFFSFRDFSVTPVRVVEGRADSVRVFIQRTSLCSG